MTGDGSKVSCCKEQYCIGTWNVRSMNQGKITSVQLGGSVMSDSLQPHEPQQTRPPCPSPTPGVYANSCPLNWWCHPTISSSAMPFSSCLQSFPVWGLFKWVSSSHQVAQSIEVSASASVLPVNIQDWSTLGWAGSISLQSKGLSRVFSVPNIHGIL